MTASELYARVLFTGMSVVWGGVVWLAGMKYLPADTERVQGITSAAQIAS